MGRPIANLFRSYPVTLWLGVGVFAYAWKASLVATIYQNTYSEWNKQRAQELSEIK
jgi:hypothetical protein